MKPSRCFAYCTVLYILTIGFIMTILAACSIIAYNCHFLDGLKQSPEGYIFHLVYFRSHHCEETVDWNVFGATDEALVEPEMPRETAAVTRAFWIALLQTIFNGVQVLLAIHVLITLKYDLLYKNRRYSYWAMYAPLSAVFFITIILDLVTSWYFGTDRLRSHTVDGFMTVLEIENRIESRPTIELIDETLRIIPSTVFFHVTLKYVIGSVISVFMLFFLTLTGWEVVDTSKRKGVIKTLMETKKVEVANENSATEA